MYIYMLRCADNSLYTGIAVDMKKRIRQHLGIIKGGAKYTRSHKPVALELLLECDSVSGAKKMEIALKSLNAMQKNEIIEKNATEIKKIFEKNLSDYEYKKADISDFVKLFQINKTL